MAKPYHAMRRVEFRDTDAAGIAHFSVFFTMMEEAEHEFLRYLGLGVVQNGADGVVTWPRVAAHCDFQGTIRFEDTVDIELHVSRLGTKSVTYEFQFSHAGRAIAVGQMTSVCCQLGSGGELKSQAIPPTFLAKLKPYLV